MGKAPSALPAEPGLISQAAHVNELSGSFAYRLDPGTIAVLDAADLDGRVVQMGRFVDAAKTLLAPRIAASDLWQTGGHRSPADHLATLEGVPTGDARRTLETGRRLHELPGVDGAIREGRLSRHQAALIAEVGAVDPSREADLLAGAEGETLAQTRERCRRAKSEMAQEGPVATQKRIFATRSFDHHFDDGGTFRYWGTDTAEVGMELMALIQAGAERLRRQRRKAAVASGGTDAPKERGAALRQDALMALVTGGGGARVGAPPVPPGPTSWSGSTGGSSPGAGPFPARPVRSTGPARSRSTWSRP